MTEHLVRDREFRDCLKEFRRVATRYDRLAINFMAAVCIAATVSYWLWVPTLAFTQMQSRCY